MYGGACAAHFGLTNKKYVRKTRNAENLLQLFGLAALFKLCLQLRAAVKMALDQLLAARDDDEHVLNPAGRGFFYQKLNGRLVDDGYEFLGQGLCQREHARPVSRRRNNRFLYLHRAPPSLNGRGRGRISKQAFSQPAAVQIQKQGQARHIAHE